MPSLIWWDCRVSVQPARGGESQRDAVYAIGLAPQLPGPAPGGERGEESHGEAAVSGDCDSEPKQIIYRLIHLTVCLSAVLHSARPITAT